MKNLWMSYPKISRSNSKITKNCCPNPEDKKLLETNAGNFKVYIELLNNQLLPKSRKNEKDAANEVHLLSSLRRFGTKIRQGSMITWNSTKNWPQKPPRMPLPGLRKARLFRGHHCAGVTLIGLLGFFLVKELHATNRLQAMMEQVNQTLDFTERLPVSRMDELGSTAF